MFESVLIANRGEIACRVIRTARRMGLRTVAVYSEADAGALHVELADTARLIGPAPARDSYLNIAAVVAAAREAHAEAIHPGYGFLAENADFAEACVKAGIVFVGPPAAAIRAMGSKVEAKRIMACARVPLVPGHHEPDMDDARLAEAAAELGYPVMIKASAGGGGKGMRVVAAPEDLAAALAGARREAKAAFADDRMLIEKALDRPRHVEVQIFCDAHGGAVHLFERECSVQRRHQKVVEEAPAPGMTPARRAEMGGVAVAAARAIDYVGAGTVEFLVDGNGFYFMEMNTRLQVEHAVTEMVTGIDLVEWQFRIAAGETLPRRQDELAIDGHAIEARVYAEDPAQDFLPMAGPIAHLAMPAADRHLRVDIGVRAGDQVSIHYDPMIAKLIVWDADRGAALRRLRAALSKAQIVGVATNLEFLAALAAHPAFAEGHVDTGFIGRYRAELLPAPEPAGDTAIALACLYLFLGRTRHAAELAAASGDPWSPWHRVDGWRLNDDNHHRLTLLDGDREVEIDVHYRGDGYLIETSRASIAASGRLDAAGGLVADLDGARVKATVVRQGAVITVLYQGRPHRLVLRDPLAGVQMDEAPAGALEAPMPGRVAAVLVAAGQAVEKGAPLMLLEAMKMEHSINAPLAGTIEAVHYAAGDQVEAGAKLLSIAPRDP